MERLDRSDPKNTMARKFRNGLFVLGGLLIVSSLVYAAVDWRISTRCDRYRSEGLEALEQGQFALAVKQLGRRLTQSTCGIGDTETLFAFAQARARVPEPGAAHIVESVAALKNVVIAEPRFADAWRELALAWLGMGQPARAVDAARRIIELNPSDNHADRLLLTGLLASGRENEALELSERALQQDPERWWLHLTRLSAEAATVGADSIKPADIKMLSDDQKLLVGAFESILRGEDDAATNRLLEASKTTSHDPILLQTLVNLMAGLDLYSPTLEMLHRHRARLSGKLRSTYVELAWQEERLEWILDYLNNAPPQIGREPGLVIIMAMAARLSGDQNQSTSRSSQYFESEADRRWHRLITAVIDSTDDAKRVDAAEQVLEIEPRNPVVLQILAESWMRLGEPRRAAAFAARAMRLARGWALPARTRAQALLRARQPLAALEAAREATRRSPGDPRGGLILARAWAQTLGEGDDKSARDLLTLLSVLEARTSSKGRASLSPIRLIATTRLDDSKVTTDNTYGRRGALSAGIQIDPNRLRSQPASPSAPKKSSLPARAEPEIAREVRRCETKIEGAGRSECWHRILENRPRDLNSHMLALSSRSGPELQRSIIDRLKDLTPVSSSIWRLARARLLLTSDPSAKTAAEAALLLRYVLQRVPDQADAHLLMAVSLAHLRDRPAVGAHLIDAVSSDPGRATEALRLSLHLAQHVIEIEPRVLIGWWESLTWLEYESVAQKYVQAAANEKPPAQLSLLSRLGVLAAYAESRSDSALAEAVYRRILEFDPDAHVASNNLAMILSTEEGSLGEALGLARKALELRPSSVDYQDTLAVVEKAFSEVR